MMMTVFEKTCASTQKNVKSRFLDFEKKRKNVLKNVRIVSEATNHSAFNYTITGSQYR